MQDEDWLLVIGADTVVTHGNKIYEKPMSAFNAYEILTEYYSISIS
jgi:predicted house-cleaning NTP pyrophosphatase (Maf/HAM1 superfamily)